MKKTIKLLSVTALAVLAVCFMASCGSAGELPSITGMTIVSQPANLSYLEGASLSLDGLIISADFSDGSQSNIEFADFAEHGILANPPHGTTLSVAAHHGNPVVVTGGSATVNTGNVSVFAEGTEVTVTFNGNGGLFGSQATETRTGYAGQPLESFPPNPTRSEYSFIGYNTAANGSGNPFTTTSNASPNLTVYAQWTRSDPVGDIPGLIFRHTFENVSGTSATTVAPVFPLNPSVNLSATVRGSYGALTPFGSRTTINQNTYWFYRTGERQRMDHENVTYLDLGAAVGDLIKNTPAGTEGIGNTFTIAFYMRLPADYDYTTAVSGQGQMPISFSSSNDMTDTFGQGFWITVRDDNPGGNMQMLWTNAGTAGAANRWTNFGNWGFDQPVKGAWIHVAYARNGNASRIFINGHQVDGGNFDTHHAKDMTFIFNTLGGSPVQGNNNLRNALFTDLRIYNRHLEWGTDGEITRLAQSILADLNDSSITNWHTN